MPDLRVEAGPADLCLDAARQVSGESQVPLPVLLAITRLETGRGGEREPAPWPWTINIEGEGHWFETRQEAEIFARNALAEGRTSFDTGCFQINFRWHGENFASVEAMFDPLENTRYAAQFLARLFAEKGDWSLAAGAYHSRTERYASRYRNKFDTLHELAMASAGDLTITEFQGRAGQEPAPPRINTFPLLVSSTSDQTLGSLVPIFGRGG